MEDINIDKIYGLLQKAAELARIRNDEQAKLPFHINVIKSAARGKLRETGHSMILADLLRIPYVQKSFLEEIMGISSDTLKVETEVGSADSRIDIVLYKENDKCIVIENKANGACEQPKQIARYVKDIAMRKMGFQEDSVYVLYLNPETHEAPSAESVELDDGYNAFKSLGRRFVIKSFAHDITTWLRTLKISDNDKYVKMAVEQYVDYLEDIYQVSEKYGPMKKAMKNYVIEALSLAGKPLSEQAEILHENSVALEDLLDTVKAVDAEYKKEWLCRCIDELARKYSCRKIDYFVGSNELFSDCDARWPKGGIVLAKDNLRVNILIEYDADGTEVYYGIRLKNKDDAESEKIHELLKSIRPAAYWNSADFWPVHERTSFKDAAKRVGELVEALKLGLPVGIL